jgi:hypothetical protein
MRLIGPRARVCLHAPIDHFRAACLEARRDGYTLAGIAGAVGVTRQRRHEFVKGRPGGD